MTLEDVSRTMLRVLAAKNSTNGQIQLIHRLSPFSKLGKKLLNFSKRQQRRLALQNTGHAIASD
jgi:hypothetical protein